MDVQNFRDLCDEVLNTQYSSCISINECYERIKEYCAEKGWDIRKDCVPLRKDLIFEHINSGKEIRPYFDFFSIIWDASNSEVKSKSNATNEDWLSVLKLCSQARESSHYFDSSYDHLGLGNKLVDFSYAWKKLISRGVKFSRVKDDYYINEESFSHIEGIIDDYIFRIGGVRCLEFTFKMLSGIYDTNQERYLLYRKTTQGIDVIEPEYPWGYIIALSVKNVDKIGSDSSVTAIETSKSFIEFLKDVVTTFEIQPYVVWESIYVDPERIIHFLQENVLYDNLISFFQFKSVYALEILNYLSQRHDDMKATSYGVSLNKIFSVAKQLIILSDNLKLKEINLQELKESARVSMRNLLICINNIFKQDSNQKLSFPPSSEQIDHVLKPVVELNGREIILPSCITSLAILNATIKQISFPNNKFNNAVDSKIGKYLERFLIERFEKSGIKVYSGDFISLNRKISGDCDLFIVSPKANYIFELKKKSLTRKAMSGEDFSLIRDLGDSVMRSQSQCAKIEYVLLTDNQLTLKNDRDEYLIKYNGMPVQKISLSLNDFGALQDKTVFNTILRLSTQTVFSSTDSAIDSSLVKWRKYLKIFMDYNDLLEPLRKDNIPAFTDNSFMSLPQLMTILDGCSDIESFDKEYGLSRTITYSTRDFYKEYSVKRNLLK
ncbi:hypothetical protein BZ160_00380 [Pantoea vagans]|nr:hypothetical protein [Pantoea vagans]OQV42617.1 hypothetical protein BZ160_00380 [Pantoea vagans]